MKLPALALLSILFLLASCSRATVGAEPCNPFPASLPSLTEYQKEQLIKIAFEGLKGEPRENFPKEFDSENNQVFVTFRHAGEVISRKHETTGNLAQSAYAAAQQAKEELESQNPSSIEISILSPSRASFNIQNYNWGVHAISATSKNSSATVLAKEFVEGNLNREKALSLLCDAIGQSAPCLNARGVNMEVFDELTFAINPHSTSIATFFRGNAIDCANSSGTAGAIQKALAMRERGEKWLLTNIQDDGFPPYLYYPSTNSQFGQERNADLREALASRVLSSYASKNNSLVPTNKKNLERLLQMYMEKDGQGYMWYWNESKLNTNALALRAIVASPLFDEHSHEAEMLAETILSHQYPNGSFSNWFIPLGTERDISFLTWDGKYEESYFVAFSSGEAILALTEYYLKTKNQKYLDAAILSQDYYLKEYVDNLKLNYEPAYVPWHTQSLYNLYLITGEKKYADAIFILNDELIALQDTVGEFSFDFKGRFFNPRMPQFGSPHSSTDGVYTEGLSYAYRIAVLTNDAIHADLYRERILLSIDNLARLQFNGANMYYVRYPAKVEGAMRSSITNNIIRVDNTQHMLDAMDAFLDFEQRTASPLTRETLGYTLSLQ